MESTDDAPWSSRPKSATTIHQIEAVYRMVMNDRCAIVQHIAETIGISVGSIHTALTYILGMSKLSQRWVPQMLTAAQKLKRLDILRDPFQADIANFLERFVTQDETWVHNFDPESKSQSKQWKHNGCLFPKMFKPVLLAR